jgi:hypothetical protein
MNEQENIFEFIEANKNIWQEIRRTTKNSFKRANSEKSDILLVEMQRHPILLHGNAIFGRILKNALNTQTAYLDVSDTHTKDILKSYDQESLFIRTKKMNLKDFVSLLRIFIYASAYILFGKGIQYIKINKINFGDILYDSYLAKYNLATISKIKVNLFISLASLIRNYLRFERTLKLYNPKAILISHNIGNPYGVLMRTALSLNIPVYLKVGGNGKVLLQKYKSLSEIYDDIYRPQKEDMAFLNNIPHNELMSDFEKISGTNKELCIWGEDFKSAYAKEKKIYYTKNDFADEYKVNPNFKYVFVMLHSFNDHPHSHYGPLWFKDYYDWFAKTLCFAKSKKDVIWIFKEHPNSKYYPTKDVTLETKFNNIAQNIIFLNANTPFNTMSLRYIADVIITVLGTAGVEFAAFGGVPPVVAGKSQYSGCGFTIEPQSEAEYFEVLKNIEKIERLNKDQQLMAQKVYLYNQYYSYVPFSWCPILDYGQTKDKNLDEYYWDILKKHYGYFHNDMIKECSKYAEIVKNPNFYRLSKRSLV